MDQFPFLNLSTDAALNEALGSTPPRPIITEALGSIPTMNPSTRTATGLGPAAMLGNDDIEQYLSGDSIAFLHQKLAEATGLNASYAQREARLQDTVEAAKSEKQVVSERCEALLNEQKNMRNEHLLLQQKVDQETRLRFTYQDKLANAQKSLEAQMKRAEESDQKVDSLKAELVNLDNFSGEVYEIANMSTSQVENLKQEISVLEKMREVYKASFLKTNKENEKLFAQLETTKERLNALEDTFKNASSDISEFKKESSKQETFITETLNRFKEITVHFTSMKEQFLLQQEAIGEYHSDTTEKSSVICAMKQELERKSEEIDEIRNLSATREEELGRNVAKLEDTLNGLIQMREELEEKSKQRGDVIENLREENIRGKAELESAKATLNVEREYSLEKQSCLTAERDECKKNSREIMAKYKSSREREQQLSDAKEKLEQKGNELMEENKTLREIVNELKDQDNRSLAERSKLDEELSTKEKEIESLCVSMANKEDCLKSKHEELSTLKKELSLLQIDKEKVDVERRELSERLDESTKNLQEEQKRIKEFEERMIKCQFLFMDNDKKYNELSEKCSQLENEKIEDKYRISKLSEEIQRKEAQCAEQMKLNEMLQIEIKESKQRLESSDLEAKTTAENMMSMAADVRQEIENYKQECGQKDEEISRLMTQVNDHKKLHEDGTKELSKTCEQLEAALAKNECLSDTVSKVAAEKQDYLVIIENFTKRESDLKTELDKRLSHQKELEHSMREQKREFDQYKVNVENYDRLWQSERDQGLKELQDELSRDQRLFDTVKTEYFSPLKSPRKSQRRSMKSPARSPR